MSSVPFCLIKSSFLIYFSSTITIIWLERFNIRVALPCALGMFIFPQIIGFGVFFVSMLAETNRVPFDLPEAETELVSGYATEYSGMRYAIFFMAEYIGMLVMSSLATICFFGGWSGPFHVPIFPALWFLLKVYAFMFVFIWIRATLPRYRYDQLMDLGWKWLIPLALANVVLTAVFKAIF